MILVYASYLIVASLVVFCSIKCARYVDLLDSKTNISGAFIGGIILAAVTSLPELITSLSSIFIVDNPELIIGNVLGSNLFNLSAMAVLILFTARNFAKATIAKSHLIVLICSLVSYALVAMNVNFGINFSIFTVDIASIGIIIVYIISFKFLADDNVESTEKDSDEDVYDLSIRQIVARFVFASVGLIVFSIIITYITDIIAADLNLNASLAGALFLGVATSLPELSSCIALVKFKNYNAMIGNIVGSNMFNFTIVFLSDLFIISGTAYFTSPQTVSMLIFGAVASVITGMILFIVTRLKKASKPLILGLLSFFVVSCYFGFLLTSV